MPRKLNWDPESTDFTEVSTDISNVVRKLRGQQSTENEKLCSVTHAASHAVSPPAGQAAQHTTDQSAYSAVAHTIDQTAIPAASQPESFLEIQADETAQWQFVMASHTVTEQKVYEVMYAETRRRDIMDWYFTFSVLSKFSGFRNRRTIIAAIDGLVTKKSIQVLKDKPGDKFGKRYRVFSSEEIIERRQKIKLKIDPQTKKVI